MQVKIIPNTKYDNNAPTHWDAAVGAVIALVLFLLIRDNTSSVVTALQLIFRGVAAIWVYYIMKGLNRDAGWSAFAAACFPILALFIAGVVKKKFIRIQIDRSYEPIVQLKELRALAISYIKENKQDEAAFVYRYMIENLPATPEDIEKYEGYKNNPLVKIPDYTVVEV